MTHRWGEPDRPDHTITRRRCERCGILRVTRHEGNRSWTEFETADGERIDLGGKTPPCPAPKLVGAE